MARKLRFFKEQMTKAGVLPSPMPVAPAHVDFDDLEVHLFVPVLHEASDYFACLILFSMKKPCSYYRLNFVNLMRS